MHWRLVKFRALTRLVLLHVIGKGIYGFSIGWSDRVDYLVDFLSHCYCVVCFEWVFLHQSMTMCQLYFLFLTFYFRLSILCLFSTLYFCYVSTPSLSNYSVFLPGSFLSLLNQCRWSDIGIRFRNLFCFLFLFFPQFRFVLESFFRFLYDFYMLM